MVSGMCGEVGGGTWRVFGDDEGESEFAAMGEAEMEACNAQGLGAKGGLAGAVECRWVTWFAAHLDLFPGDAAADTRAKGFGRGLFGCEAGGEALGGGTSG